MKRVKANRILAIIAFAIFGRQQYSLSDFLRGLKRRILILSRIRTVKGDHSLKIPKSYTRIYIPRKTITNLGMTQGYDNQHLVI